MSDPSKKPAPSILAQDSMLQSDELPLSEFINDQLWQSVFEQHLIDFGSDEDSVYTPAITLWALISQVFFKGENRSCKAAVIRIASLWAMPGKTICNTNTGACCRARLKVSFEAVRDISRQLALFTEAVYHKQAADTPENQEVFPQKPVSTGTGPTHRMGCRTRRQEISLD